MLSLLGVVLSGERFQLGKKSLAKLFATEIPCNLVQLQSLLGKLNFASTFVADYKRKVAPLINLLSSKSGGQWTEEHTQALNELGEMIWQRTKLALVDMQRPLRLHVDADDTHLSVVLAQDHEDGPVVCGMAGRKLQITEATLPLMEKLLMAALWDFKRYGRYCYYASSMIVMLPHVAELAVVNGKDLPVRLQARLIELSSL